MTKHLLERGSAFWKSGQKEQAQNIFKAVIYREQDNEIAWLWYVYTLETDEEKISALEEMLKFLPASQKARLALNSLQRTREKTELKKVGESETQTGYSDGKVLGANSLPKQPESSREINNRYKGVVPWVLLMVSTVSLICVSLLGFIANRKLTFELEQIKLNYFDIQTSYNTLMKNYNDTQQAYQKLKDEAIIPPYIYTQHRELKIAFNKLDGTTTYWEVPFDTMEDELYRGLLTRDYTAEPNNLQELYGTGGQSFYVEDMTMFVDPGAFENVIPQLYYASGDDESFIKEIWNIVTQLAIYSEDIGEKPRYPLETFLAGGGDCEDTAILFASMILAAPVDWTVELVYMDLDNVNAPQEVNHVIVAIDTGQSKHLIETTSPDFMEPYANGVTGWFFEVGK